MKRIYLLLLCTICFGKMYSQNHYIDPIEFENLEEKVNSFVSSISEEDLNLWIRYSSQNPFITENWDTNTFDPYRNHPAKTPFQLIFNDSSYASPIEIKKVITSRYGWRNRRPHKGIDIDLVTGDDVRSLLDGKVRYVKYHGGHGKAIVIRHSNGLELVYAHLSKQLVQENDIVKKGQIIGKGGITGNARGSHLHLETIYKGIHINPEYIFDFSKQNKIRSTNIWVSNKWTTPHLHSSRRQSKIDVATNLQEATNIKVSQLRTHKVRKGDSLYRIARHYGVSISAICKANKISRLKILKPGQRLIIGL